MLSTMQLGVYEYETFMSKSEVKISENVRYLDLEVDQQPGPHAAQLSHDEPPFEFCYYTVTFSSFWRISFKRL